MNNSTMVDQHDKKSLFETKLSRLNKEDQDDLKVEIEDLLTKCPELSNEVYQVLRSVANEFYLAGRQKQHTEAIEAPSKPTVKQYNPKTKAPAKRVLLPMFYEDK